MLEQYKAGPNQLIVLGARMKEKSPGGIVIPDNARGELPWGSIVLVGQLDAKFDYLGLQPGLTVYWPNFAGTKKFTLNTDGEDRVYIVLDAHDVALVGPPLETTDGSDEDLK